jgi:Cu-processing system permease protein
VRPRFPLLRFELSAAYHGRTALLFAIGFALASMGVALAGLAPGGVLAVQGFARTSVSLLQLVLWVVPLLGLATGAIAGAECHELELVAALPVPRERIVLARWVAWTVVMSACLAIGFGAAGLLIGALAGAADGMRYLALVGIAVVLVAASLALGLWIGVVARSRARAIALAVVAWFVLAVGVDLVVIATLAFLPPREVGWGLSLLLLADPVDSARALAPPTSRSSGCSVDGERGCWLPGLRVGRRSLWLLPASGSPAPTCEVATGGKTRSLISLPIGKLWWASNRFHAHPPRFRCTGGLMKVAELMHTTLKTISADATVADAVAALAEAQVSALPVLDRYGRAVGVLSTREILKAEHAMKSARARDRLFDETLALEIMASWPVTIAPDADVRDAAREMLYLEVQRLFVEDRGVLVGVISQTDIVGAVATQKV